MNQAVINKYTKTFGCRFLRYEKRKFLKALDEDFNEIGYSGVTIRKRKWLSHVENVFYGNLKQVKNVIVVPYDTVEKRFWHNVSYYPLDSTLNLKKSMIPLYMPAMILFVILFVGVYFIQPKINSVNAAFLMSLAMFSITIILLYNLLIGFRNRKNYNRNTSSILCALEIAKQLNKEQRQKVGFLFTDKNRNTYFGAQSSMDYFNEQNKQPEFIILDCVGVGSSLQIGYNPQNRKVANELAREDGKATCVKLNEAMRMQGNMSYFKKAVMIACGELVDGSLCIKHTQTNKDCVLDEACMNRVVAMVVKYIKKVF